MPDISTGQIFVNNQQNINAPIMNGIIGLAVINSSFISNKTPITNLQSNDNFILARNDGSWARITGSALADGLVLAEPNYVRSAVGSLYSSVMNGDMIVNQQTASFSNVGSGQNGLACDRWFSYSNAALTGKVTASQQAAGPLLGSANNPETKYCHRCTVTTPQASLAAGDYLVIQQTIEQQIARAMFDNTTSFSIWLRSNSTGTFCVALRNTNAGTPSQSYVMECVISSANVWQRFTFPAIVALPTGSGTWGSSDTDGAYMISICIGAGVTFQTVAGTWQSGNFLADGSQTNLLANNGATLDFTLVQHEIGSICTPFIWTPFDVSLMRCCRYYNKSYDYPTAPGTATNTNSIPFYANSATGAFGFAAFKNRMRKDPVINFYSPTTGTSAKIRDVIGAADVTPSSSIAGDAGITSVTCSVTAAASGFSGGILFHYTATGVEFNSVGA